MLLPFFGQEVKGYLYKVKLNEPGRRLIAISLPSGFSILYDGAAMLVWPRGVFHRIRAGEDGSASLNFVLHYEGSDIKANFNIYDLNTARGRFKNIR